MRTHDPFHQALDGLMEAVGSGRLGWGEPLIVAALAADLRLRQTPIREALARMAGEGLIEHRPGRGYSTPRPTAQDIAELYRLHQNLCEWSLTETLEIVRFGSTNEAAENAAEAFFVALVDAASDRVMSRLMRRTSRQLRPLRRLERQLTGHRDGDEREVADLSGAKDRQSLRVEIDNYHRRRREQSEAIAQVIWRDEKSIDKL